jgi:cytochrome bd-type quinol oxidase subunit 2
VLGYVLIWAYAHISEVSIGSVLFVYGTVAVLMFVSYAIYRALLSGAERASGESGSRARRTTAITMLVALNIYYIAGANGIATVISRIAAREDLVTATMISILAIVAATSLVWLKRAWRLPLQPYMQW